MSVDSQCCMRIGRWMRTSPDNIPILLVEFAIILMRVAHCYDPSHEKLGDLGEKGPRVTGEGVKG